MAITATFKADFSSFLDAIDKAEIALVDFSKGASRVESSLNRMVDKFSGRKLIQDAMLMTKAIEEIGGATKLTEQELASVGAVAADAANKMRALGMDVPENMANLAKHAREAKTELADMGSLVKNLAGAFGVTFSLQALGSFVMGIAESAKQMRNLSIETGISTTKLQEMAAVTGDLGVSMDDLGRTIYAMSTRVAGGDQSAAGAIHALGLSLEDLKGKSPDEMFRTLLKAIDQVPDHLEKTRIAADLFGSRVGAAVVRVAKDFDQAVEAARKTNKIMSEDSVRAGAKFAETWDRMKTNIQNTSAHVLGPGMSAANSFIETWENAPSRLQGAKRILFEIQAMMRGMDPGAIQEILEAQGKAKTDISLPKEKPPTPPLTYEQRFLAIQKDQLQALTEQQEHYLDGLYDLGILTEANAKVFDVSAEQMEAYRRKTEETIQTQAQLSDQLRAMKNLQSELLNKGIELTDQLNQKKQKQLDIQDAYIQGLKTQAIIQEDEAKRVNIERALGPQQANPATAAMDKLNATLERIADMEAKTGMFMGESRVKAYQDLDEAILGKLRSGVGPGGLVPPTTVNASVQVSGVLDPRTVKELAKAVSDELMYGSGRQFENR